MVVAAEEFWKLNARTLILVIRRSSRLLYLKHQVRL